MTYSSRVRHTLAGQHSAADRSLKRLLLLLPLSVAFAASACSTLSRRFTTDLKDLDPPDLRRRYALRGDRYAGLVDEFGFGVVSISPL